MKYSVRLETTNPDILNEIIKSLDTILGRVDSLKINVRKGASKKPTESVYSLATPIEMAEKPKKKRRKTPGHSRTMHPRRLELMVYEYVSDRFASTDEIYEMAKRGFLSKQHEPPKFESLRAALSTLYRIGAIQRKEPYTRGNLEYRLDPDDKWDEGRLIATIRTHDQSRNKKNSG